MTNLLKGMNVQPKLKKALAGVAACAVASSGLGLLGAGSASAAGTPQPAGASIVVPGGTTPLNSGGSSTAFSLSLGSGASCGGDTTTGGYKVQSYMVPTSVDPSALTFNSGGPVLPSGTPTTTFKAPLYDTSGSSFLNKSTQNASPPAVTGQINQPLPGFNYAVFLPGDIPAGTYNIGIACTLGTAGPTQMKEYWNVVETISTDAADSPAQIRWDYGTVPAAPVITSVTPDSGTLTAVYSTTAATPGTSGFTATATPVGGGAPVTATSAGSPTTITGLTNGTQYSVTVHGTNAVGNSAESNPVTATPAQPPHPAVTGLTATPGTGKVDLSWTAPSDAGTTAPTGYTIGVNPSGGTTTVTGTTASVTGLTAGTPYSFTVTATYASPPAGATSAPVTATPLAAQVLLQTITVNRPVGALVFTQVCGVNGDIPADTLGTTGFPSGSLPAIAATTGAGTSPTIAGGGPDPKFSDYPYPQNADGTSAAVYPTTCGVDLGNAKLISKGPGAGQYFAASGKLNQITVVDSRDTDIGWTANGTMGDFTAGSGKSFSGSQLGWSPVRTSDSAAFTDSNGNTYDQVTTAGPVVNPNTPNASGLGSGRTLASAAGLTGSTPSQTGGLGVAIFDARLKLLIPITAKSGTYVGTLTVSAV